MDPQLMKQPPWVKALVDQRMAFLRNVAINHPARVIVMPLREMPDGENAEHWERVCDKCETYCPPEPDGNEDSYFAGICQIELKGKLVMLFYGMCPECFKEVEKHE